MKVNFIHELAVCEKQVNDYISDSRFIDAIKPADLAEAVFAYINRAGKRLRPAVMMWSCGACGGNPEKVLPAAVAVEIFHTWTLVHDDL
ncbi:MAG: polyprenyl synthetase family protein, partial [Armatimonadota bacterium]